MAPRVIEIAHGISGASQWQAKATSISLVPTAAMTWPVTGRQIARKSRNDVS